MCRPGLEDWEICLSSMNMKVGSACLMIFAPWVETSTFATSSRRWRGSSWRGISTIIWTYSNQAISSDGSSGDLGEEVASIEGCLGYDLMGQWSGYMEAWVVFHVSLSESICACSISVYVFACEALSQNGPKGHGARRRMQQVSSNASLIHERYQDRDDAGWCYIWYILCFLSHHTGEMKPLAFFIKWVSSFFIKCLMISTRTIENTRRCLLWRVRSTTQISLELLPHLTTNVVTTNHWTLTLTCQNLWLYSHCNPTRPRPASSRSPREEHCIFGMTPGAKLPSLQLLSCMTVPPPLNSWFPLLWPAVPPIPPSRCRQTRHLVVWLWKRMRALRLDRALFANL